MILNKIILTLITLLLFNQGIEKVNHEKGSVVFYTAEWCEPCVEMELHLKELQQDPVISSKFNFYVVNINEVYCEEGVLEFPNEYHIEQNMIYPTVKIFKQYKTDAMRGFGFTYQEIKDFILE